VDFCLRLADMVENISVNQMPKLHGTLHVSLYSARIHLFGFYYKLL